MNEERCRGWSFLIKKKPIFSLEIHLLFELCFSLAYYSKRGRPFYVRIWSPCSVPFQTKSHFEKSHRTERERARERKGTKIIIEKRQKNNLLSNGKITFCFEDMISSLIIVFKKWSDIYSRCPPYEGYYKYSPTSNPCRDFESLTYKVAVSKSRNM